MHGQLKEYKNTPRVFFIFDPSTETQEFRIDKLSVILLSKMNKY